MPDARAPVHRAPIDRTKPPYRDDPVIARLTDEQIWAVADVMARLATSYARKLEEVGVTAADLLARPRPPY
jgi:hypothetical protein